MGEQTSPSSPSRPSADAIEAEIAATRAHLDSTIDELAVRVKPKEIVRRQVGSARAKVIDATHTPEGDLRVERVGALAVAVAAVLLGLAVLHRHHHGSDHSSPHSRHHGRPHRRG
jgi:hypothetical protein